MLFSDSAKQFRIAVAYAYSQTKFPSKALGSYFLPIPFAGDT